MHDRLGLKKSMFMYTYADMRYYTRICTPRCCAPCSSRSISTACRVTAAKFAAVAHAGTDRQRDGRTPDRCIDSAPPMWAMPISGVARIWRWGAQGVWGTEVPQQGPGAEPLVGGSGGGIASRKLIAVIKGIWLPNHAQFCVFSSTAQPGIFL